MFPSTQKKYRTEGIFELSPAFSILRIVMAAIIGEVVYMLAGGGEDL